MSDMDCSIRLDNWGLVTCKCWTAVFSCYLPVGTKEETIKVFEKSGYSTNET